MPRFPIDETAFPKLGKALARAVYEDAAREAFVNDPRSYLTAAGVDPKVLDGYDLSVVEDKVDKLHFVIPTELNKALVDADDQDYLRGIGFSVTLACTIMSDRRVVPLPKSGVEESSSPAATGTDG